MKKLRFALLMVVCLLVLLVVAISAEVKVFGNNAQVPEFDESCMTTGDDDPEEILRQMLINVLVSEASESASDNVVSFEPYTAGDSSIRWNEISSASSYYAFFFNNDELVAHCVLDGAGNNYIDLGKLRKMLDKTGVKWQGEKFVCVVRVYSLGDETNTSRGRLEDITLETADLRQYPNELQEAEWNEKAES